MSLEKKEPKRGSRAPVEGNAITPSEHPGQYVHLHAQLARAVEHAHRDLYIKVVDAGVSVTDYWIVSYVGLLELGERNIQTGRRNKCLDLTPRQLPMLNREIRSRLFLAITKSLNH